MRVLEWSWGANLAKQKKWRKINLARYEKTVNPSAEMQHYNHVPHNNATHTIKSCSTQKNWNWRNALLLKRKKCNAKYRDFEMLPVSQKQKCGPRKARLSVLRHVSARQWHRIQKHWAHHLHRAMSDAGGAVLDSDSEYFLLQYAKIIFILLTFVFEISGILHRPKTSARLPGKRCKSCWSC